MKLNNNLSRLLLDKKTINTTTERIIEKESLPVTAKEKYCNKNA